MYSLCENENVGREFPPQTDTAVNIYIQQLSLLTTWECSGVSSSHQVFSRNILEQWNVSSGRGASSGPLSVL